MFGDQLFTSSLDNILSILILEEDKVKYDSVKSELNITDSLSKPTSTTKFYEHNDLLMGRLKPMYTPTVHKIDNNTYQYVIHIINSTLNQDNQTSNSPKIILTANEASKQTDSTITSHHTPLHFKDFSTIPTYILQQPNI